MPETELADPYMTPQTMPARRPMKYLAIVIILAIILLSFLAASMMVWWSIGPSRLLLDRAPPVDQQFRIEATRSPSESMDERPALTPESSAP